MQPSRLSLLLTATLLLAPAFAAQAQRVVEGDLQQQMSTAEFKAAGLDKLSPDELAALNAWLQGKVRNATATGSFKPARLQTGITVQVPQFVGEGDRIKVSTDTGEYMERA